MEIKIGDVIVHRRDGLTKITEVREMGGEKYFFGVFVKSPTESVYIPTTDYDSIVRPILTVKEADEVIKNIKKVQYEDTKNTKQRRDALKRRLSSGDVNDIAFLYKQLLCFNELNKKEPTVKLGPVDIDMLNYARDLLLEELSLTYNLDIPTLEKKIISKVM